jgi:Glycogen recognition site of AMP-activated protein kinase
LIIVLQTPVSPLLKPADPIFNQVMMKDNQDEMFDYPPEKEIPVLLVWTFGGKNVSVEGSWDHWKTRYLICSFFFSSGNCVLVVVNWTCGISSCGVSQLGH